MWCHKESYSVLFQIVDELWRCALAQYEINHELIILTVNCVKLLEQSSKIKKYRARNVNNRSTLNMTEVAFFCQRTQTFKERKYNH